MGMQAVEGTLEDKIEGVLWLRLETNREVTKTTIRRTYGIGREGCGNSGERK
jgi:hypothetical protein